MICYTCSVSACDIMSEIPHLSHCEVVGRHMLVSTLGFKRFAIDAMILVSSSLVGVVD